MTLKSAAFLALIGTILMTALLLWTFVLVNVLRDLVPAVTLFPSFIYAFGCFSIVVFFYLFPPSAVVVILARVHFSTDRMPCVNLTTPSSGYG